MNIHPTNPGEPEILTAEELVDITGRKTAGGQSTWLREHGWRFEISGDRVIVGRLYCRLRLCGVDLSRIESESDGHGWTLDDVT